MATRAPKGSQILKSTSAIKRKTALKKKAKQQLEQEICNATIIASWIRHIWSYRNFHMVKSAVLCIQKFYLSYRERKLNGKYAVSIQSKYRSYVIRRKFVTVQLWMQPMKQHLESNECIVFSSLVSPMSRMFSTSSRRKIVVLALTSNQRLLINSVFEKQCSELIQCYDPALYKVTNNGRSEFHVFKLDHPKKAIFRFSDVLGFAEKWKSILSQYTTTGLHDILLDEKSYPIFDTSPILKQGYLVKRAIISKMNWRARYFVLRDGSLSWYKGLKLKGAIPLDANTLVSICDETPVREFTFDLTYFDGDVKRVLRMQADSAENLDNWCIALQMARYFSFRSAAVANTLHQLEVDHQLVPNLMDVGENESYNNTSYGSRQRKPSPIKTTTDHLKLPPKFAAYSPEHKHAQSMDTGLSHGKRVGAKRNSIANVKMWLSGGADSEEKPEETPDEQAKLMDCLKSLQSGTSVDLADKFYRKAATLQQQVDVSSNSKEIMLDLVQAIDLCSMTHALIGLSANDTDVEKGNKKVSSGESMDQFNGLGLSDDDSSALISNKNDSFIENHKTRALFQSHSISRLDNNTSGAFLDESDTSDEEDSSSVDPSIQRMSSLDTMESGETLVSDCTNKTIHTQPNSSDSLLSELKQSLIGKELCSGFAKVDIPAMNSIEHKPRASIPRARRRKPTISRQFQAINVA